MSAIFAGIGTAAATIAFWAIARRVARARDIPIGTLPVWLPTVAAATAFIVAWTEPAGYARSAILAGVAVAALIDARTGFIFDPLSAAIVLGTFIAATGDRAVFGAIVGSLGVGSALGILYVLTRRVGIGLGDVKLGLGVGAALGWNVGLTAIGLAFVFGAAYGIARLIRGASRRTPVRFGPFVAAGTYVAILLPNGGGR
jgi:leader peptidase (prepilin peptidase)/N-methyltransferase